MIEDVLIITHQNDTSVELVISALETRGHAPIRINIEDFPTRLNVSLLHTEFEGGVSTFINAKELSRSRIKSVWYWKPYPPILPPDLDPATRQFVTNEVTTALWSLYTTLDAKWINPPLIGSKLVEDNKLYQLRAAAECGMHVPETLISNDPSVVIRFAERCGGVVALKTLYSTSFNSADAGRLVIYTRRATVDELRSEGDSIRTCPVFVQRYIPKKVELRVTVVGDELFPCAIYSQENTGAAEDWRRANPATLTHEIYVLPKEVTEQLRRLIKSLGLVYGAIDLIVTPTGDIYFLEINPNGQWHWVEELTGLPISNAIAGELAMAEK